MTYLPRLFGFALAVAAISPVVMAQTDPAAPAAGAAAPADAGTPAGAGAPAGAPAAGTETTPATPAPGAETPPTTPAPGTEAPGTAAPAAGAPGAAAPGAAAPGAAAPGTEAPAATPGAAPAAASGDLAETVHNFFHYALIARYDLAAAQGQQLLTQDPKALLAAMNAEARERSISLDPTLLKWEDKVPLLKETATALRAKLEEARKADRADPAWIQQNIDSLGKGELARRNAISRLKQSGELAVPQMVAVLRDPRQQALHAGIRLALREMGRMVLNPLVAATEMKNDPAGLVAVCEVLSEIPFPDVVPYLMRVAQDRDQPQAVKAAVTSALQRTGADPRASAGDLFYDLAERGFYYRTSGITYDNRNPAAYFWTWDNATNMLSRKDVPPAAWYDVMAMRAAEAALRMGSSLDAVSLWLAADNKRETDLKEGETSGVYADAPAHFWNVRLGVQYCNNVLTRAMKDQNTPVALKVVKSLQEIAGQSNGATESSLLAAMRYADRRVRYEAALALGGTLPTKAFAGQERVVQLLAEAVSQTGAGGLLILAPTDAVKTQLATELKGFTTAGATTADSAIAESASLPSVDVIVISEETPNDQVRQFFNQASQNPRLERAAKLMLVRSRTSGWFSTALTDPLLSATTDQSGEGLTKAIEAARTKAGGAALDEKGAADFSLRSASLLGRLATSRAQVLDLSVAEPTLLSALNDKRPEIAKAVAGVLGQLDSQRTQPALIDKAAGADTAEDVKVASFKALAASAKFYGNRLDAKRVDVLRGAAKAEASQDVKNAAAEAIGALNLPVDQIKTLILDRTAAAGTK